jgi:hypothetical protein
VSLSCPFACWVHRVEHPYQGSTTPRLRPSASRYARTVDGAISN